MSDGWNHGVSSLPTTGSACICNPRACLQFVYFQSKHELNCFGGQKPWMHGRPQIPVKVLLGGSQYEIWWNTWRDQKYHGMDMVIVADKRCGSFRYLHADAGPNQPILFSSRKNIFQLCTMAALWTWTRFFFGFGNKKWHLFCWIGGEDTLNSFLFGMISRDKQHHPQTFFLWTKQCFVWEPWYFQERERSPLRTFRWIWTHGVGAWKNGSLLYSTFSVAVVWKFHRK